MKKEIYLSETKLDEFCKQPKFKEYYCEDFCYVWNQYYLYKPNEKLILISPQTKLKEINETKEFLNIFEYFIQKYNKMIKILKQNFPSTNSQISYKKEIELIYEQEFPKILEIKKNEINSFIQENLIEEISSLHLIENFIQDQFKNIKFQKLQIKSTNFEEKGMKIEKEKLKQIKDKFEKNNFEQNKLSYKLRKDIIQELEHFRILPNSIYYLVILIEFLSKKEFKEEEEINKWKNLNIKTIITTKKIGKQIENQIPKFIHSILFGIIKDYIDECPNFANIKMNELIDLYKTLFKYFIDPCEKVDSKFKQHLSYQQKKEVIKFFEEESNILKNILENILRRIENLKIENDPEKENIFSFPDYALSQRLTEFFKELKLKYIIHLYRICYKIYQKKRRENNYY
ncbi:hypothetical protein M0811_14085 [Anaeramoeba ignava]|uniref:Uncharacterized protein n=1 Tax=Anaeramoeba ignava TaxID=1746090 RepID=A0A9Q0LZ42_ANAIG|nr:hypothetical protein M0811_14085 [Anaeramoeba ignava]